MATYSGNADSERCKRAIRNAHARRSRRFAIASVALIVVAGAPSGGAGLVKPTPSPAQTLALNCPSPALGGTLPTLVYLPAGYRTSTTHYPVVYFLHGLPANPTSYKDDGFVAAALATAKKPAIVVTPQGARSAHSDREYLDWSPTENWPRAISHDLVQLAVFGAVESWSGYFAATNPAGTAVLDLGSPQANASAAVPTTAQLNAEIARDPSYIAFYVGAQDPHFLQDNENFNSTLTTAGIQHTFAIYPGGHSGVLWRGEASTWLANAIDYVAALRRDPRGTTGTTGARGATGAIGATGAT